MILTLIKQGLGLRPREKRALCGKMGKLYSELTSNSDVNHRFRSLDFRDFLEKHLHFCIRYLMDISKYNQNATRQYQTLFYFIVNHHIQ